MPGRPARLLLLSVALAALPAPATPHLAQRGYGLASLPAARLDALAAGRGAASLRSLGPGLTAELAWPAEEGGFLGLALPPLTLALGDSAERAGHHHASASTSTRHDSPRGPPPHNPETRVGGPDAFRRARTGAQASPSPGTRRGCAPAASADAAGYAFEVEDDHDYFVGENGLLVHNACPTGVGGTGANYKKLTGQGLYVLKDPASKEVLYVGRGDVPARFLAHAKDAAKGPLDQVILWTNNLSKAQAKGLEQALIERFGGAYSKTYANVTPSRLMNQINSFRKLNPNYYFYRRAVTPELFKETLRRIGR